jgi:hypothetical protein
MISVPDCWRNQYTTLDAKKAKATALVACASCGTKVRSRQGKQKYCRLCSPFAAAERKRQEREPRPPKRNIPYSPKPRRAAKPKPIREARAKSAPKSPHDDFTGAKCFHLHILHRIEGPRKNTNYWLARCACGTKITLTGTEIVNRLVRHCGCQETAA